MAPPLSNTTQAFSSDQQHHFAAHYWPVTTTALRVPGPATADYTAFGSGIEFAFFDVHDSTLTLSSTIEEQLVKSAGKTGSVLGYSANGSYRTGVVPVIYDYWGTGAPTGGSRAKQVLLKYSGFVTRPVTNATLVFCGQGTVLARVRRKTSGAVVSITDGAMALREPLPNLNTTAMSYSVVTSAMGYATNQTPISFSEGDFVEIYYLHQGEAWGGFAAKVILGNPTFDSADFLKKLREAPVLGTSFMAKEADPVPAQAIRYVESADIKVGIGTAPEMEIKVALAGDDQPTGYSFAVIRDEMQLVDNADRAQRIRKGRVVHLEGGFTVPGSSEPEVYPRFTGYIDDLFPSPDGESCIIQCRGFEGLLTEVFDENLPDRTAYHAAGFVFRDGAAEPVYGIPAFDQWPLETAVQSLCYKAGIDPFSMGMDPCTTTSEYGRWAFRLPNDQVFSGSKYFYARSVANPDNPISLERQSNYGNVPPVYTDSKAKDDPYLFGPQVTQRLYDRVKSLTEHFGYDCHFNAEGQLVLSGRNNPIYFQYFTKNGTYSVNSPTGRQTRTAAVGGEIFERQHSQGAWSKQITGYFSRLDLYVGIGQSRTGLNGGKLQIRTERRVGASWVEVSTQEISTAASVPEAFYYSDVMRQDGTSATLFPILEGTLDEYRVTITPAGPEGAASDCTYRLNGVAVYERNPSRTSMVLYGQPIVLTTLGNVLSLTAESNAKDMRNHVVVVGSRKATITDSEKVANDGNPNNQEYEFHVSTAVDPYSIYDPTSANFVGSKRMTVVFDEKVSDSDMARWLTRTILYRYRIPKTSARFSHTVLPTLTLRDPLRVREERHETVDHLLWVSEFTERWSNEEAVVDITGLANPEIPSYQPREDVDVDALFDHDGDGRGETVINMAVEYKNIYGQLVGNSTLTNATGIRAYSGNTLFTMTSEAITNGSSFKLAETAVPESIWLSWNARAGEFTRVTAVSGTGYRNVRSLVNNPYRHFFHISSWDANRKPTLAFNFHEGDGTAGVYDKTYYEFPSSADNQWYVTYEKLTSRSGLNPYYDPYTSEVGNFVRIAFDLLVSGRVRVSLWDANRSDGREVPVAWLTRPTEAGDDPDAHYVYMEAGEKEFYWDGVDNIGFWNVLQSVDYADETQGAFGERPNAVGKGFYAWNDKSTSLQSRIGDLNSLNFGPDGAPIFGMGQYGQFYIKVEVQNPLLTRRDKAQGIFEPRTTNSHSLANAPTWNTHGETYVWTHLPEPSQVGIRAQEWDTTKGQWSSATPSSDSNWLPIGQITDAQIRDGRPVRFTFVPEPRKGVLFMNNGQPDRSKTSAKLNRLVHLRATIFDQFWTFAGKPWEGVHETVSNYNAEQKRLTNRMFHNDDHTIEYEDAGFRAGSDLLAYEWIFDPTLFKKDFTGQGTERLRFGDYEQLEELPGFQVRRQGGAANAARAYLTMAYINYLFYFSAFTMDRSGRRQWCINSWTDPQTGRRRGFIDKSKIADEAWQSATDTEVSKNYMVLRPEARGAERYLQRSIFVRQWHEPSWTSANNSRSPVAQFNITNPNQLKFVQPLITNFNLSSGYFAGNHQDKWLAEYGTANNEVNREVLRFSSRRSGIQVPPTMNTPASLDIALTNLGMWAFTNGALGALNFNPSPSRDFHPYWRYPFMPDWAAFHTNYYTLAHGSNPVSVWEGTGSQINYKMRDIGAQENWFGYAFFNDRAIGNSVAPRCEKTATEALGEDPRKVTMALAVSGTAINSIFDYVRQDQLDRWDQFRGLRSRGPYQDRTTKEDLSYREGVKARSAPPQPVSTSGVYLMNMARYSDYTLAPVHLSESSNASAYVHFTDRVTDWFNVTFFHEYVWYSERYFPVTSDGGPLYGFCKSEYTKAYAVLGDPWWAKLYSQYSTGNLLYDAGAWTGWKPDATNWESDKHLRWRELNSYAIRRDGPTPTLKFPAYLHGGYGGDFAPTGQAEATQYWLNSNTNLFRRTNIFDENLSATMRIRLAVGPTLSTARPLIMNLTLPKRLMGL
jgi:hypothetical protein